MGVFDGTLGHVPSSSYVNVDRAYATWSNITGRDLCSLYGVMQVRTLARELGGPPRERANVAPALDQFLTVVTKAGGTVKTEIWGKRRLAYEIKKQIEGIYAIVTIESEPAAVAELDRQLNLNESVLRTKLMRPEAH